MRIICRSYRAAIAIGVPVTLQQHELWLRANSPVTCLFEVALHGGEAVRAGVGEEGNVAHFVVREEVGCRGQVRTTLRSVGIDCEVERNGSVLSRDGVLCVELHKPIANLVFWHPLGWSAAHPEVVVSGNSAENLRFRLLAQRCEPRGCSFASLL